MRQQHGVEVKPVVDLRPGHDQRVAWTERTDRQKGDARLVLPDEPTRQLAGNNPAEDTGHL
jgi:hypothetical protein